MTAPPDFRPYDPDFSADPYVVYDELHTLVTPVYSEQLGMHVIGRHADILEVLRDPRFGRSTGPPGPGGDPAGLPHVRRFVSDNLLEREGPRHTRLRRVFARALGARRINGLTDFIETTAAGLIDAAAATGAFDFIADIAEPLSVAVIAELIGWPASERHRLRPWSARIVRLYERDCTPADRDSADRAARDFARTIDAVIAARGGQRRNDVVGALLDAERAGDLTDRDELIASCMLLLNAGHESTVNAAGNGVLALLNHPAAAAALRNDARRLPGAVEELLRYDAPLHFFHRYALADLEFRGVRLRRGDRIGLLYGCANRDPDVFADPATLDIERRPNRHFAFGAETHFCLGAALARRELATVYRLVLALPELRLAASTPDWRPGFVFRGLSALPLVRIR